MTTDRTVPDVLRSSTTITGEQFVGIILTTETQKSPAICLDLGNIKFIRHLSHIRPLCGLISQLHFYF